MDEILPFNKFFSDCR